MTYTPTVSVIVATRALHERRYCLQRALESILEQKEVRVQPIVIVNGERQDGATVAKIEANPRILVVRQTFADLPNALRVGASQVATPYFTALDDDDVLLDRALAIRIETLASNIGTKAVVTNGFCRSRDGDTLVVPDMRRIAEDPLSSLTEGNWLLPGAWLCATSKATLGLFDGMPRYLECTYLAIRFAQEVRTVFSNEPTVAWTTDSPGSESTTRDYRLGQVKALHRLLELQLPKNVERCFRGRLRDAQHASARLYMAERKLLTAWRSHTASLLGPGGWRHLPFTLRLFAGSLRWKRATS